MNTLLSIGKILNFHGIKGEVKVGYTKGKESQLKSVKIFSVKINNQYIELHITSLRFHKQFAIVKFEEINSINDFEQYKDLHLYVPKEVVEKNLDEDEYLVSDLDGLQVYDNAGSLIGKINNIGENIAGNILCIQDSSGKTHMVPFVKELVPVVDIENNKIVINNIEGLIN